MAKTTFITGNDRSLFFTGIKPGGRGSNENLGFRATLKVNEAVEVEVDSSESSTRTIVCRGRSQFL